MKRSLIFLILTIGLLILVVLGLGGATMYVMQYNELDRSLQLTITSIYSTNTAVSIAIMATETGKAWTPTPAPDYGAFVGTPPASPTNRPAGTSAAIVATSVLGTRTAMPAMDTTSRPTTTAAAASP